MSSHPLVKHSIDGAVLEITIDNPPANAINAAISQEVHRLLKMLQESDTLRVAIMTGAGERIFSAGWDLKDVARADNSIEAAKRALEIPGGFAGITEYWDLYKPVIAAVNGFAVGGGFEIVLASDIVIACEGSAFFLPEMQRGFLPDAGAIQRLPKKLPINVATELMLTGRRMMADEAKHWGLVNEVVPRERLMARAREVARTVAQGAPLALQALKETMRYMQSASLEDCFAMTRRVVDAAGSGASGLPFYERMMASDDFMEGARAFAEKRPPVFRGK